MINGEDFAAEHAMSARSAVRYQYDTQAGAPPSVWRQLIFPGVLIVARHLDRDSEALRQRSNNGKRTKFPTGDSVAVGAKINAWLRLS